VPTVEHEATLTRELAEAGVVATPAAPPEAVDVRAIRDRLGLTQEQFALRYGLDLDAVRNWEHGRRRPDTAARSYLRVSSGSPGGWRRRCCRRARRRASPRASIRV
jgi:DNA-binding transcriptional regulator YiaG